MKPFIFGQIEQSLHHGEGIFWGQGNANAPYGNRDKLVSEFEMKLVASLKPAKDA